MIYVILFLGISILIFILTYFFHPLAIKLNRTPEYIFSLPLNQLPNIRRLLGRGRRLKKLLSANSIPESVWQQAVSFYENKEPRFRCELIAKRIGKACDFIEESRIPLFRLRPGEKFVLGIDHCYLAFPPGDMQPYAIINLLEQVRDVAFCPCLIFSLNEKQQIELRQISLESSNFFRNSG